MSELIIKAQGLTKDYGQQKGIFNESFSIQKGQMVGFLGTNGSGKTTTIRCLLGFIKPSSGVSYINGLESHSKSSEILKQVGYVPGEIAFPDVGTGTAFLHSQAELLGLKDFSYANYLIEKLQLDPKAGLKRMSKGMKQKTALVAALMANPEIIIMDEPTTGLDPLMRESFIQIIADEHKKGKTIIMSSHMFEEVEETCDQAMLISNGHLIDQVSIYDIHHPKVKSYKIEFNSRDDYLKFKGEGHLITRDQEEYSQVTVQIDKEDIGSLLLSLKGKDVKFISEITYTLEKHFLEELNKNKEGNN